MPKQKCFWHFILMDKKPIEKAYPEAYRLARRFHEFYEQSAPFFGYETKKETKEFDPESNNGRLVAWVCYEIVKEEKEKWEKRMNKKNSKPLKVDFYKGGKSIKFK